MKQPIKLFISVLTCELVGIISTPFTIAAIPTWYATLNKPFFSPPNWIFGPVWTILYAMMGISVYLIWVKDTKNKKVQTALTLFAFQLMLNFAWSFLFFSLHNPLLGLLDIVALWLTIALTIRAFYPLSKPATYLLLPYILWVSFAMMLNLSIVLLN